MSFDSSKIIAIELRNCILIGLVYYSVLLFGGHYAHIPVLKQMYEVLYVVVHTVLSLI